MLNRIVYLGYYIKTSNWKRLIDFNRVAACGHFGRSVSTALDSIFSCFRYNISLYDYYLFGFHENKRDRESWAGTGYMYEYQKKANPPSVRSSLSDKRRFCVEFARLINRKTLVLRGPQPSDKDVLVFLQSMSGCDIVLKNEAGQCGVGILRVPADHESLQSMREKASQGYGLAEEAVRQHVDMEELSCGGVNTVRVITEIDDAGEVHVLGARLRINVEGATDNLAAGNLAAAVDVGSGEVFSPAVYSDLSKEDVYFHPATGARIKGFVVPVWEDVLGLARQAAMVLPECRSVGWDVAITPEGPELIEGNHNWCKLLWQLPVKKGLKADLLLRHLMDGR